MPRYLVTYMNDNNQNGIGESVRNDHDYDDLKGDGYLRECVVS